MTVSQAHQVESGVGRIDRNVVFGTYCGLALLMDVHHPPHANGYALALIPGSGWTSRQTYDAPLLTTLASSIQFFVPSLLDAGYTLFVLNHRNGPRFHHPDAVNDVQRAIRFIRFWADKYQVNPSRIGAVGFSSGGQLAALLGVLESTEAHVDADPVSRVSPRVQSVVAAAAPMNFMHFHPPEWAIFIGQLVGLPGGPPDPIALEAYRDASPIAHVSASSAPMLLLHGDADDVVPVQMAQAMHQVMKNAGADVTLIELPGGSHNFARESGGHPDWPDFLSETVRWIDCHLKS